MDRNREIAQRVKDDKLRAKKRKQDAILNKSQPIKEGSYIKSKQMVFTDLKMLIPANKEADRLQNEALSSQMIEDVEYQDQHIKNSNS